MNLFKLGNTVPESGKYICLGCGEISFFIKGSKFSECTNCHAGSESGPSGYMKGVAFWKFLEK